MEITTQESQAVSATTAIDAAEAEATIANEPQPVVATVGYVVDLNPIAGADRIQLATVDCGDQGTWNGVVTLDINAGDKVLVLLQDAVLPQDNDRWAFMSKHKWRVRMARFKGVPSECVILPATDAETLLEPGADCGSFLGITKYTKALPPSMVGKARGYLPEFLVKTDEVNFQKVRDRDERMAGAWEASIKYDGMSGTSFVRDGVLRVCSRNLEVEDDGNVYFQVAHKYQLQRVPEGLALQFEVVGPGIQGNPLDLVEPEIRAFTLFDITNRCKAPGAQLDRLCSDLGIPRAKVVYRGHGAVAADDLRKMAEVKYPNGNHAEGIVIRTECHQHSMKVINLLYKEA